MRRTEKVSRKLLCTFSRYSTTAEKVQSQLEWRMKDCAGYRRSIQAFCVTMSFRLLQPCAHAAGSVPVQVFVGVMHYWSGRGVGGVASSEAGGPSPPGSAVSAAGGAAFAAERRYADIVLSCRLTPPEVTGFVAEAKVDAHIQEISYAEHIKAWVATIFEIRLATARTVFFENKARLVCGIGTTAESYRLRPLK